MLLAASVTGCIGDFGRRSAAPAPSPAALMPRPSYCPELRVRAGTDVMRRYARGREGSPKGVVFQGSIADTAKECRLGADGSIIVRIGVSGRAVAGPQGGSRAVNLPLRVVVVKYEEAVLSSDLYSIPVSLDAGSGIFSRVFEAAIPNPGASRDYIVYVGFDEDA